MSQTSELLFSYGTLQIDAVQFDTFGRTLNGKHDALVGYRIAMIRIKVRFLCVTSVFLCVSVVKELLEQATTETQRTQRSHREDGR